MLEVLLRAGGVLVLLPSLTSIQVRERGSENTSLVGDAAVVLYFKDEFQMAKTPRQLGVRHALFFCPPTRAKKMIVP